MTILKPSINWLSELTVRLIEPEFLRQKSNVAVRWTVVQRDPEGGSGRVTTLLQRLAPLSGSLWLNLSHPAPCPRKYQILDTENVRCGDERTSYSRFEPRFHVQASEPSSRNAEKKRAFMHLIYSNPEP
jgi:hypothetical protein